MLLSAFELVIFRGAEGRGKLAVFRHGEAPVRELYSVILRGTDDAPVGERVQEMDKIRVADAERPVFAEQIPQL